MINSTFLNSVATTMTLAAANIDGNITDLNSILMDFLGHISVVKYNLIILCSNVLFLLICFLIRYFSYFKIADIDRSNEDGIKLYKRYRSYVFIHIFVSALFAFIVCSTLVMLVNSNVNMIWNFLIAPLIGFMISIWFDSEILAKYEDKYKIFKNPLNESDKESSKKDDHNDTHNEINININNGTDDAGTDDKFVLEGDQSLTDAKKIEATINRIIDVQKEQSVILEKHTQELKDQNIMLKSMQTLLKNNIKFELEDMIYEVLDRGYATPAEDKRIRVKYNDYRNNKGNSDLQELYESRYLELDVHEHRESKR